MCEFFDQYQIRYRYFDANLGRMFETRSPYFMTTEEAGEWWNEVGCKKPQAFAIKIEVSKTANNWT